MPPRAPGPAAPRARVLFLEVQDCKSPGRQAPSCWAGVLASTSATSREWVEVRDGNGVAATLYQAHHSQRLFGRNRPPGRRIVGSGERIVLIMPDAATPFVWRRFTEARQKIPAGDVLPVFRREQGRWPWARLYTYVAPWMVRSSNRGYRFPMAGWRKCRTTGRRLVEPEKMAGA